MKIIKINNGDGENILNFDNVLYITPYKGFRTLINSAIYFSEDYCVYAIETQEEIFKKLKDLKNECC